MAAKRTTVAVQFPTPQAALDWFDAAREFGVFPAGSELYKADALDMGRGGDASTYIVRGELDGRIADTALRNILGVGA